MRHSSAVVKSEAADSKSRDKELAANGRVEFATFEKRLWLAALGCPAETHAIAATCLRVCGVHEKRIALAAATAEDVMAVLNAAP